jgi:hypothetical protein
VFPECFLPIFIPNSSAKRGDSWLE